MMKKKKKLGKYDKICFSCKKVIKNCLAERGVGPSWTSDGTHYWHFDCYHGKEKT